MRMPWSKKEPNPQTLAIHASFAASVLQKPSTQLENEGDQRENYLITSRFDIRKGAMTLINRDAGLNGNGTPIENAPPNANFFLNGNLMALEAFGADVWACNRLEKQDINIAMRDVRIAFWEIAEHLSEEDIEHGFLQYVDMMHLSIDHALLNCLKGWMTNRIKEHVATHEVIMSKREASRRIPGLGGNE